MHFDPVTHGRRFLPEYPPHGHSDHLPMAWFALSALGADSNAQRTFAAAYLPRLVAMPPDHPHAVRVGELKAEIDREGTATVLARRLPPLASGWYRLAYHPLIRMGYGVEFGAATEVAAGLAYLEAAGPDPILARRAADLQVDPDVAAENLFRHAAALGPARESPAAPNSSETPLSDSFTRRAEWAVADPGMAAIGTLPPDPLRALTAGALTVFAGTHDFFALHLVTASHAFRLLEPWLGGNAAGLFALGLLAGYRAAGAPSFPRLAATPASALPTAEALLALCADDEHDIKLAHAAVAHARHWLDPRYLTVAETYLARRSGNAARGRDAAAGGLDAERQAL
jgi:hypothetical protein